jgi:hypothetical protein
MSVPLGTRTGGRPLYSMSRVLICCMEILFLTWLPLFSTFGLYYRLYLLCCNKIRFIDLIKSLVVFTLVGLWFIHFLLSLVTYRQPMPLQLCDVSHYRLMQSWMWEILLHGHILSLGTWSCSYPYFLALEVSYPPSPIHQGCFRSWGCLLATIIYSLGESSLSLSPIQGSSALKILYCHENSPDNFL